MSNHTINYGEYYHIYHRGNNREAIFREEKNYKYFVDLYRKYIYPIADLYAYCLLPTHFHLLLRIKDRKDLIEPYTNIEHPWRQFRSFLGTYVKEINKAYHRSGYLFEGKYSRKLFEKDDYFYNLILYIHQNPQNHGIVSNYRFWPFSSYQIYLRKDLKSVISQEIFSDFDLYNTIIDMHHGPI
ncbi:MAG: hypothetical protein MUO54_05580 [Anaerolineales bacterium]|nr:hypothetical protein [Anaerolineales bacterium]